MDECWIWQAGRNPQGYGQTSVRLPGATKIESAYRVAYRMLRADPAPGNNLDHLCNNPPCVNPWHLEEVSFNTNVVRGRLRATRSGVCMDPRSVPMSHRQVKPGYRVVFEEIERAARVGELKPGSLLPRFNLSAPSRKALISWLTISGLGVERHGRMYLADRVPDPPLITERPFEPIPVSADQYYGRGWFKSDPGIHIALPTNDLVWATTPEYRSMTVAQVWDAVFEFLASRT